MLCMRVVSADFIGAAGTLLSLGRYENNSHHQMYKYRDPSAGAVIPADVLPIDTPSDHALSGAMLLYLRRWALIGVSGKGSDKPALTALFS